MNDNNTNFSRDIDLVELSRVLIAGKIRILSVSLLFFLSSVVYALYQDDFYSSEVIFHTHDSSRVQPNSGIKSIASFAGVNLGGEGQKQAHFVIETIKSRKFLKDLLEFDGVLESIMAPDSYNKISGKLSFNGDLFDSQTRTWVREENQPFGVVPSYIEAHELYSDMLKITLDEDTGFVKLGFEHISPVFSKKMLDLIVNQVNYKLREKTIKESQNAIQFLTAEISSSNSLETRDSIATLIKDNLENQVRAKVKEDFIISQIEPAYVPVIKSKPNRTLIVIFGTFVGFLIGSIVVLLRFFYSGSSQK
tara:strand:+ start:788 stop:1708 length:921 start_codon:yes stop_codon:yes gene_type:complete